LLDRDSNLVSLSDFSGKYVYLNFCTSFSYSCIKEFELLRDMNDRQKDRLQIITIIMDGEHASLNELIGKYDFEWVFLHHGLQPRIRTDYDIKAFPAYFLIGPDGKFILSPAPSPAENFEQLFFQVMRSRGDI
jgi:peroxiredoxin